MKRTNDDRVDRIALELSLKPFGREDGRSSEDCARDVVEAWRPLLAAADEVSFMLWVADGSEILEYRGNPHQRLEWGRYIGFSNASREAYDPSHHPPSRSAILFDEAPREFRYADLKSIIAALRSVGQSLLDRPVSVGATFDPGPEFADSAFKYERHREIIVPKRVSGRPTFPMVDASAVLHADAQYYAAYPDGIPEGEPFAVFLGKQIDAFCHDLGFDYVWLSNGFGFSAVAWDYLGPGFDGERFLPEIRAEYLERFKQAWVDLRRGNPDIPVEVRGSNFAAGMDIAKDGVDFAWLYERGYVRLPPPNSPWGALNFDFGLEIAGYLSRVVKSPQGRYLFRYYPNDPWFWQNPWTDVFYGEPYDIFLPLATSVIAASGAITTPSVINILTGDTEFGETDPLTGVQVGAQIRTALAQKPDDVGLVTWVYPFDAYHGLASAGAEGQAEVFFGDWFVRSAINNGLPVATVATPDAFDAFITRRLQVPGGDQVRTVVFAPTVAAGTEADAQRFLTWLAHGVPVLLYGPAASLDSGVLALLGLELTDGISGELTLLNAEDEPVGFLVHDPVGSAGVVAAQLVEGVDPQAVATNYTVKAGDAVRAYSVAASVGGTPLIWIRGTNAFETRPGAGHLALKPRPHDARYTDASALCAEVLGRLGYAIDVQGAASGATLMLFSRHDNAWYLSGYAEAPVGEVALRFPMGAPIFHATYARLIDGAAHYPLARSMRGECRVFVRQESGVVGCDTRPRDEHHQELTLRITGLENAAVTFLPPCGAAVTFEHQGGRLEFDAGVTLCSQSGLSGELQIRW